MLNTGAGLTRQVALNHISRAHDKLLLRLISVCGGGREQLTNPFNLGGTSHLAPMSHGRRSPPPGQGSGAAGRRGPRSACPGPAGGEPGSRRRRPSGHPAQPPGSPRRRPPHLGTAGPAERPWGGQRRRWRWGPSARNERRPPTCPEPPPRRAAPFLPPPRPEPRRR